MMEIKGTAILAIRDFVKMNYQTKFIEWLNSLPDDSKLIYTQAIDSSKWYPLFAGGLIPTRKMAEMFYDGDYIKGALEAGQFSAEKALTGIYKIFVKTASPSYIIQRASRIFATYYQPCKMEVLEKTNNHVLLEISDMTQSDIVIEYRIAGWINKALEISGAANVRVDFPKSITRGDTSTQLDINWD
jgi:hypothetical protein